MIDTRIERKNWVVHTNEKGGRISYSKRAGNEVEEINFSEDDFYDLYAIVTGLSQLHAE